MQLRQPPKLPNNLAPLEVWLLNLNRASQELPMRVSVPASSTSAGQANSYAFNATHLYICYDTNSWARIAYTDVVF